MFGSHHDQSRRGGGWGAEDAKRALMTFKKISDAAKALGLRVEISLRSCVSGGTAREVL